MRVLGIDPGATGALVLLRGDRISVCDMPFVLIQRGMRKEKGSNKKVPRYVKHTDAAMLAGIIKMYRPDHAWVEKVHSMPKQGVSSTFAFGRCVGVIEGVLAGLGIPMSFVTPQAWQKELKLIKKGKGATRQRASELWPYKAKAFRLAKHDGRADAAMIGRYGRRQLRKDAA